MPLDTARLIDSDLFALSSGDEFKAALALWCKSWTQLPAASLPNDDRVLAHLSGAGARWKKVRAMAMRGWVLCDDGRWYHRVVAEKANDAWERREDWQAKQVVKNERQQRWRDKVKALSAELRDIGVTPPTNVSLSTLERLLVDAHASTGASTVDEHETALTGTGTETETEIQKTKSLERTARAQTTRGSRLPADWTLPPEWRAWARTEHPAINPDLEAAKFRDYWHARTGSAATKADWQATWRNWVRNAKPNGAGPQGRPPTSGGQLGYASEEIF